MNVFFNHLLNQPAEQLLSRDYIGREVGMSMRV
jgi:hypothetical protein